MALVAGLVCVHLEYAHGLKDCDWLKKQDPYCILTCAGQTYTSATHKSGGSNPVWDQRFNFHLNGENSIDVEIMDADTGRDDKVGSVTISLAKVRERGTDQLQVPVIRPKSKKQRGYLYVSLTFTPTSSSKAHAAAPGVIASTSQSTQQPHINGTYTPPPVYQSPYQPPQSLSHAAYALINQQSSNAPPHAAASSAYALLQTQQPPTCYPSPSMPSPSPYPEPIPPYQLAQAQQSYAQQSPMYPQQGSLPGPSYAQYQPQPQAVPYSNSYGYGYGMNSFEPVLGVPAPGQYSRCGPSPPIGHPVKA